MLLNIRPRRTCSSILISAGGAAFLFFIALPFDRHVMLLVRALPEEVIMLFANVSRATEPVFVLPLIAYSHLMLTLMSGWRKSNGPGMVTGLCLISATLALFLTFLVKVPVGRARPQISAEWDPFLFMPFEGSHAYQSLPSAQAATIAAMCLCVTSRVPGSKRIVLPVALLLSLPRVIIERHWLSDVVAGWVIGGLAAYASVLLLSAFLDDGMQDVI